eukprot:2838128-Rhodomonas_salina.1
MDDNLLIPGNPCHAVLSAYARATPSLFLVLDFGAQWPPRVLRASSLASPFNSRFGKMEARCPMRPFLGAFTPFHFIRVFIPLVFVYLLAQLLVCTVCNGRP